MCFGEFHLRRSVKPLLSSKYPERIPNELLEAHMVVVLLVLGLLLGGRLQGQIPTPSTVLGHTPGDDFDLADYEEAVKYF
jgi:hypothetical protein